MCKDKKIVEQVCGNCCSFTFISMCFEDGSYRKPKDLCKFDPSKFELYVPEDKPKFFMGKEEEE